MRKILLALIFIFVVGLLVFSENVNAQPESSLVGYWKFDEGSGTSVIDSSGNGNDGLLKANAKFTAEGKVGSAVNFDGKSAYVQVPNSESISNFNSITIAAWIYPNETQPNWISYIYKGYAFGKADYALGGSNVIVPTVYFTISNRTNSKSTSSYYLTPNKWTFISGTYDGNVIKLYIDGAEVASTAFVGGSINVTSYGLGIGERYGGGGADAFNGTIDEVRVYSRALVSTEIKALYNSYAYTTTTSTTTSLPTTTTTVPAQLTITVALDGSGDFTDIQKAIDSADPSTETIILIKEGVYQLNPSMKYPFKKITVKSNLTLRGAGIDHTIISSFPNKQPANTNELINNNRTVTINNSGKVQNLIIENLTVINQGTPDNGGTSAISLRDVEGIVIMDIKVTDAFGAGIGVSLFENLTIENCITNRTWSGIIFGDGKNAVIRNNTVLNTRGDGIFPRTDSSLNKSVKDAWIEDNYIENIGDTGIDITSGSNKSYDPHERIVAVNNKLRNATVRISNARNITFSGNLIKYGSIDADAGASSPIDIKIENNTIESSKSAIRLAGATNVTVKNNIIYLLPPLSGYNQVGIASGAWGSLIQNNIILNSGKYCIDFASYRLGGTGNTVIENNTLVNYNDTCIFDNSQSQGKVFIKGNKIFNLRALPAAKYGVFTNYTTNIWNITDNWIYSGLISAPKSEIKNNNYSYPDWFYFPTSLQSNKMIFSSILFDSVSEKLKINLEDVTSENRNEESIVQIFSPAKPTYVKIDGNAVQYDDSLSSSPSWKYDATNKIITVKFFCQ